MVRSKDRMALETKEKCIFSNLQEHLPGILDVLLDLDQKLYSLSAVKQTMIIRESQVHHRSDDNLSVDNNWLIVDGM